MENSALNLFYDAIHLGAFLSVFVIGPYTIAKLLDINSLLGVYLFVAIGYFIGRYVNGAILYSMSSDVDELALMELAGAPVISFMIKAIFGTGFVALWKIVESIKA